ncbi:hypothetical protein [Chryseobacterium sp. 3008163]|uniref:hypothetical protein n=1 Tax=Chryseobacterium sp. 3008163 TaxID=2478663 RepID=UPI001013CE57|nr:hypothetical protein [Chryseobacterium sp. 3008163]
MYFKCIFFLCLLGLSALLSAQTAEQIRINIRIFPSQVLSITTAEDSKSNDYSQTSNSVNYGNELTASNLYGYQIKLINAKLTSQTDIADIKHTENKEDCSFNSKLVYSKTSSTINQKIPTSHLSHTQREVLNKCFTSETNRMLVYLIITQ